jgi:hypothetical protein
MFTAKEAVEVEVFYYRHGWTLWTGFFSFPERFVAEGQGFTLSCPVGKGISRFQHGSLPKLFFLARFLTSTVPISIIRTLEKWVLAGFLFPSEAFCVSLGRRLLPLGLRPRRQTLPRATPKRSLGQRNPSKTHFFLVTKILYYVYLVPVEDLIATPPTFISTAKSAYMSRKFQVTHVQERLGLDRGKVYICVTADNFQGFVQRLNQIFRAKKMNPVPSFLPFLGGAS